MFVAVLIIKRLKNNDEFQDEDEEEDVEDIDSERIEDSGDFSETFQEKQDEVLNEFESEKENIPEHNNFTNLNDEPENLTKTLQQNLTNDKIKKAKELELGVGELDLALNIRAKLKGKKRLAGKEEFIIEMYNHGMTIENIAKKLNLNFGEVDLVIGLNKHRLLKHR